MKISDLITLNEAELLPGQVVPPAGGVGPVFYSPWQLIGDWISDRTNPWWLWYHGFDSYADYQWWLFMQSDWYQQTYGDVDILDGLGDNDIDTDQSIFWFGNHPWHRIIELIAQGGFNPWDPSSWPEDVWNMINVMLSISGQNLLDENGEFDMDRFLEIWQEYLDKRYGNQPYVNPDDRYTPDLIPGPEHPNYDPDDYTAPEIDPDTYQEPDGGGEDEDPTRYLNPIGAPLIF